MSESYEVVLQHLIVIKEAGNKAGYATTYLASASFVDPHGEKRNLSVGFHVSHSLEADIYFDEFQKLYDAHDPFGCDAHMATVYAGKKVSEYAREYAHRVLRHKAEDIARDILTKDHTIPIT